MNTLFTTIAPTTRKARINYLVKIGVKNLDDYSVLNDVDNIVNKYIADSDNANTQATRIFHIIEFLKAVNDKPLLAKYNDKMKAIKEASIKKQNDTATKDKSERYEIPLKDLQVSLLSKNPYPNFDLGMGKSLGMIKAYQDYILMAMYVLNPALRNDLHNLSIIKKAGDIEKKNYLVVNPRALYVYLNEFKNSRSMGPVRVDLTDYTKQLIRNLFKIYTALKLKPASLFNHVSATKIEPMTEDALKKRVKAVSKQYFGKELSINDYRHIWEISIQNDESYRNLNLNDREAVHKQLLHSLNTAMKYNRV
jgi:hypothetical protein